MLHHFEVFSPRLLRNLEGSEQHVWQQAGSNNSAISINGNDMRNGIYGYLSSDLPLVRARMKSGSRALERQTS